MPISHLPVSIIFFRVDGQTEHGPGQVINRNQSHY